MTTKEPEPPTPNYEKVWILEYFVVREMFHVESFGVAQKHLVLDGDEPKLIEFNNCFPTKDKAYTAAIQREFKKVSDAMKTIEKLNKELENAQSSS